MEHGILVDIGLNVIADILDCVEVGMFMTLILYQKLSKKICYYLIVLVYVIGIDIIFCFFYDHDIWLIFARFISYILPGILCFEGKAGEKIAKAIFAYSSLGMLFEFVNFFCHFFLTHNLNFLGAEIIKSIGVITLIIIIHFTVMKKSQLSEWIISLKKRSFWIGSVCFATYFAVNGLFEVAEEYLDSRFIPLIIIIQVLFFIVTLSVCITLVIIDKKRNRYRYESNIKEEYLASSIKHYDELQEQINDVRRARHDMKAHYYALETFIDNKNWEEAKEYLDSIREHQTACFVSRIYTGNYLVDAVLSEIIQQREDITVRCVGSIGDTRIKDFDLCTIFSNLLKNAVEANDKLTKGEKWINIEIRHYEKYVLIEISNPVDDKIDICKSRRYTSKLDKDNHGWGLTNVRETVEQYGGEIEVNIDNFIFCVKIHM